MTLYSFLKLLNNNNIHYIQEYSFPDLVGVNGGLLRFDFAIFLENKLERLIEFQGEQHYQPDSILWSANTLKHDKIKLDYCKKNHIKLILIPYWKRNSLTLNDLLSDQYQVTEVEE